MMLPKFQPWLRLSVATIALFVLSCDQLHEDEITNESVALESKIFVLADAPTTFDLQSRIKATQPITVSISNPPQNGDLADQGKGLYQYAPKGNVSTDEFEISVKDSKGVESKKTIQLARTKQADAICGAIANSDNFYGITGSAFDMDVLQNDIVNLCGGRTELSIYRPEASYPPYEGTAEIHNGKIHYTPKSSFKGYDKFFYQLIYVSPDGTREAPTYGRVYLSTEAPCTLDLTDDSFQFSFTSVGNTVKIHVETNDVICKANNNNSFEVIQKVNLGKLKGGIENGFTYELPAVINSNFTDSFVYKICIDGTCDQATVTLSFSGTIPTCSVKAANDEYSTVGSPLTEFRFPVLDNDSLCGESIASITIVERKPEMPVGIYSPSQLAQVSVENGRIYYKPGTLIPISDSVIYEVTTTTGKVTQASLRIITK